jgi:DNA-binding NarL/FixJ family response regulator
MISVLLADDHVLLREGLRQLLTDSGDIQVAGEAGDGHEAVRLAQRLTPEVIVMDLAMPRLDGLDATKQITGEGLTSKVLVLTMHANEEYAVRVLQAGARGLLGKGSPGREVLDAIRKVAAGGIYLPPLLREELIKRHVRAGTERSPLEALTDRELQVLKRIAEGLTSEKIGQDLHLSPKTIETYRSRLLEKLTLSTTSDLIRFALRHGVIADTW